MFAKTVQQPVDRHVASLVDAINRIGTRVHTFASCSGHLAKSGIPYVAITGTDWSFVRLLLTSTSRVNDVTGGRTRLELVDFRRSEYRAALRLTVYPWLQLSDSEWTAAFIDGTGAPPRRLVKLWWDELDELARMISTPGSSPCSAFELRIARAKVRFRERSDES